MRSVRFTFSLPSDTTKWWLVISCIVHPAHVKVGCTNESHRAKKPQKPRHLRVTPRASSLSMGSLAAFQIPRLPCCAAAPVLCEAGVDVHVAVRAFFFTPPTFARPRHACDGHPTQVYTPYGALGYAPYGAILLTNQVCDISSKIAVGGRGLATTKMVCRW